MVGGSKEPLEEVQTVMSSSLAILGGWVACAAASLEAALLLSQDGWKLNEESAVSVGLLVLIVCGTAAITARASNAIGRVSTNSQAIAEIKGQMADMSKKLDGLVAAMARIEAKGI